MQQPRRNVIDQIVHPCKGSLLPRLIEQHQQHDPFDLLQGDIVEKLGGMASAGILNAGDAQTELARRVSQRLGIDIGLAQRRVGELIARGVLQLESKGNGLRWRWIDTQNLRLANDTTSVISCPA